MEPASSSKTLVPVYQSTQLHIPEESTHSAIRTSNITAHLLLMVQLQTLEHSTLMIYDNEYGGLKDLRIAM
jgi:hypothetical protein